jgi:hypothetical protein
MEPIIEPLTLGAKLALVTGLFSLSFMLNVPFGFMRGKFRKLSFMWFLCIHATIPIIYLGRMFLDLDYRYIPVFIAAAVLGQVWGGRLEF